MVFSYSFFKLWTQSCDGMNTTLKQKMLKSTFTAAQRWPHGRDLTLFATGKWIWGKLHNNYHMRYRIIIWEICTLSWLGSRGPIDAPLLSSENIDELRLSDISEENTEASENVDIVDGGRAVSDVREPREVKKAHAVKLSSYYSGFPTKFQKKIPRFSKVFFQYYVSFSRLLQVMKLFFVFIFHFPGINCFSLWLETLAILCLLVFINWRKQITFSVKQIKVCAQSATIAKNSINILLRCFMKCNRHSDLLGS